MMPNVMRPGQTEGTYVFESVPTALTDKWSPYRQRSRFNKTPIKCSNTEYLQPVKKVTRWKKFRGGYLESDVPAVAGRLHMEVQTDLYLEELVEHMELIDKCVQTDDFLNRPATPFFIPQKSGINASTQIYDEDLFDFDLEVRGVLGVLISKTMEQALLEVMEEEELANIRCEINRQGELRAAYLTEIARREEQNRRYREELERRIKEARGLLELKKESANKIAINHFVTKMLEPLLPNCFDNLFLNGYFKDPVKIDLQKFFIPKLLKKAAKKENLTYQATLVVDYIIRDAVKSRRQDYQSF